MKFWKKALFTVLLFTAIIVTVFYTACERNVCDNVTCYNGGSCNTSGKCSCPTGYENIQCQTKSVSRFVGVYPGYTSCNTPDQVIDTAFIYADSSGPQFVNYVWIVLKSDSSVLHGYVEDNQSVYSIVVPEDTFTNYSKSYSITLQNNTTLTIASWELNQIIAGDTMINKCKFVGVVDTAL